MIGKGRPLPDHPPTLYAFDGGAAGSWRVTRQTAVAGEALAPIERLDVVPLSAVNSAGQPQWRLRGQISNIRYAHRDEVTRLRARQEGLGRPRATLAALIPIRKSPAWWDLAQDERRAIFEEQSHHTRIGLAYLPGIARQLYHARDLGEPFDFMTWFEFAPEEEGAFDRLLDELRSTREWTYVDRETEIRLERDPV